MSYQYSCADAGAFTCGCKVTAESEEELRGILTEHLAKKHKIATPSATVLDHLVASANQTGAHRSAGAS